MAAGKVKSIRFARSAAGANQLTGRTRSRGKYFDPKSWRGHVGRPGWFDEMANKFPSLARFRSQKRSEVGRIEWDLRPVDDETPEEAQLRALLERVVLTECVTNAAQMQPSLRGSFKRVMQWMATRDEYGHATFERRWAADPDAHGGLRLELFHIHPSTVHDWHDDRDTGALISLRHQTDRGGAPIPADRLLVFPHVFFEGEYEGNSEFKSLGLIIEIWEAVLNGYAVRGRREGGVLVISVGSEADGEDVDRATESALEVQEDQEIPLVLPEGMEAKFLSLTAGGTSDPIAFTNLVQSLVNDLVGDYSNSLGAVSGSGSRALGEQMQIKERAVWEAYVQSLASDFGEGLFPMVARDLGFERMRVPKLVMRETAKGVDPEARRSAVSEAVQNNVIPRTPEVLKWLGEEYGLPDDVVASFEHAAAMPPSSPAAASPGLHQRQTQQRGQTAAPVQAEDDDPDGGQSSGQGVTPDGQLRTVYDVNGEPFEFWHELNDLEANVAWNEISRERKELDAQLDALVEGMAEDQRREVRELLRRLDRGEIDDQEFDVAIWTIRGRFEERARTIIDSYIVQLESYSRGHAGQERDRQDPTPIATPAAVWEAWVENIETSLEERIGKDLRDIERLARRAADTMVRRIENDIVQGWSFSPMTRTDPDDVRVLVTTKGLTKEAKSIGNRAEGTGRLVDQYLGSAGRETVAYRAVRSSVRDENRCKVCADRHNASWILYPDGLAEFANDPRASVPDPECHGTAANCRCGFLLEYRAPRFIDEGDSSTVLQAAETTPVAIEAKSWEALRYLMTEEFARRKEARTRPA